MSRVDAVTAKEKREAQAQGIKYGCHIDLVDGQEPDECVKDFGDNSACSLAKRHRSREGCEYWQPVARS